MSAAVALAVGIAAALSFGLVRAGRWRALAAMAALLVAGAVMFFGFGVTGPVAVVVALVLCVPALGGLVAGTTLGLFWRRWGAKA